MAFVVAGSRLRRLNGLESRPAVRRRAGYSVRCARSGSSQPLASSFVSFLVREALIQSPDSSFENLKVSIGAESSWDLLLGRCSGVSISAGRTKFGDLRASRLQVTSDPILLDVSTLFRGNPPQFLREFNFDAHVTLRSDDIVKGTFAFETLQMMIKELLRVAVSGALGRVMPNVVGGLEFTIGNIQIEQETIFVNVFLDLASGARYPLGLRTSFQSRDQGRVVCFKEPTVVVKAPITGSDLSIPIAPLALLGIDLGQNLRLRDIGIGQGRMEVDFRLRVDKQPFLLETYGAPGGSAPQRKRLPKG